MRRPTFYTFFIILIREVSGSFAKYGLYEAAFWHCVRKLTLGSSVCKNLVVNQTADEQLFNKIVSGANNVLHTLLPPLYSIPTLQS